MATDRAKLSRLTVQDYSMFRWLWKRLKLFALALDYTFDPIMTLDWKALITLKNDRTMSETFARWRRGDGTEAQKEIGIRMCAALDLVDKGHCDKVLAAAEKRKKDDGDDVT